MRMELKSSLGRHTVGSFSPYNSNTEAAGPKLVSTYLASILLGVHVFNVNHHPLHILSSTVLRLKNSLFYQIGSKHVFPVRFK